MSEKVEIVSIKKSEFIQGLDKPSHPQGKEFCAYCKHSHINKPPCCCQCRTTVETSDGKIFYSIVTADIHCNKNNRGEI